MVQFCFVNRETGEREDLGVVWDKILDKGELPKDSPRNPYYDHLLELGCASLMKHGGYVIEEKHVRHMDGHIENALEQEKRENPENPNVEGLLRLRSMLPWAFQEMWEFHAWR